MKTAGVGDVKVNMTSIGSADASATPLRQQLLVNKGHEEIAHTNVVPKNNKPTTGNNSNEIQHTIRKALRQQQKQLSKDTTASNRIN